MHALVPKVVYLADCATRVDLYEQSIADERAYVAAWLARARDMWKTQGGTSYFTARQPNQIQEIANGIDAILVIQIDDLYKAVGIEAKRPGFITPLQWDKKRPPPKFSRFHNQLNKQAGLDSKGWAMGALFINDICPGLAGPPGTDTHGATFMDRDPLLHASLPIVMGPAHRWKTSDLLPLLAAGPSYNLEELLEEVVACRSGRAMSETELLESALVYAADLAREEDRPGEEDVPREEDRPRDTDDDPDEFAFEMHPSTRLLRKLCRYTGATSALLLDASGPGPGEVEVRPRWRESALQRTLKPATKEATPGPRLRF